MLKKIFDFDENGLLKHLALKNSQHVSALINMLYDTRSDLISPHSGILLQLNSEFAYDILDKDQKYVKGKFTFQVYQKIV